MNVDVFKELLAVQTVSYEEQLMVDWLVDYIGHNIKGATVAVDSARNIYVNKGNAEHAPCVSAHIDTVQRMRSVRIFETAGGRLIGFDGKNKQVGIGADDKAGIFVCLNLLERFDSIRAIFFATEEVGCVGARQADPRFFKGIGYVIEYDCPSRNMLSYSCGGEQLFANDGLFIKTALPVLKRHGTDLWQRHPYTDVMVVRKRFPISCLNLSCGYYNWHGKDEFVLLSDVSLAIEQGADLIDALGPVSYPCPVGFKNPGVSASAVPVTGLRVPSPVRY